MTDETHDDLVVAPRRFAASPRFDTPIVPRQSISGTALIAVVAIMTFLAALTIGAVLMVNGAAGDWQADVAREVSIQVKPAAGRDIEASVARAAALAKGTQGVAGVQPLSKEESAKLLEPWLGGSLSLDELPVPRMIVVTLAPGASPDFTALRSALASEVPGAFLDDHRGFIARMRAMSATALAVGFTILILMLAATIVSVGFATRGAMAANRPVIEVLHFVGAKNGFIAGHFQRHFFMLGLEGGAIGGGAAIALFALGGLFAQFFAGESASALFGDFSIGLAGYIAVLVEVGLIAIVTAWTSRHTVNRTLDAIE